ncbi:MAG: carbohydrate ABC transporter permease [Lachnospiraceae bacterium]|nr:carbohydrate ABC transporter permease [Lachnospiraceae bacterium]
MSGKKISIKKILFYLLVTAILIISILPILWSVLLSFKTNNEIVNAPLALPDTWNFSNYQRAMDTIDFGRMYFNTIFIVVIATFFSVAITFMSSFAIARMTFKKKNTADRLYFYLLMGISIPIYVLLFPIYRIDSLLGILGTRVGLILPYIAVNISFNTLLFVGFLRGIPEELEEAAIIDGCGLFRLCTRVVIPIMKPTFVTIVIFNAVYIYNEFPFASTFIQSDKLNTVSLMTSMFKGQYSMDYSGIIAASLMIMLPELIFYVFLQKYIIGGMTAGAVKG